VWDDLHLFGQARGKLVWAAQPVVYMKLLALLYQLSPFLFYRHLASKEQHRTRFKQSTSSKEHKSTWVPAVCLTYGRIAKCCS
jgi:hypothetical protein